MLIIDETFKIIKQRQALAELNQQPNLHDFEMD